MADHEEEEYEGASPGEQLIEACRRNQTDLLTTLIEACPNKEAVTLLLNETKSVLGNYAYHEAALNGNYEVIDILLDQENFECDPINRREGDTPLHSAIRWINEQPEGGQTVEYAKALVDMMCKAGSDPTFKNRARQTPLDLVDARNKPLRSALKATLDIYVARLAQEAAEERAKVNAERDRLRGIALAKRQGLDPKGDGNGDGNEESDVGSGSDSDFDINAFRKERGRLKREKEKGGAGEGAF